MLNIDPGIVDFFKFIEVTDSLGRKVVSELGQGAARDGSCVRARLGDPGLRRGGRPLRRVLGNGRRGQAAGRTTTGPGESMVLGVAEITEGAVPVTLGEEHGEHWEPLGISKGVLKPGLRGEGCWTTRLVAAEDRVGD